MRIRIQDPKNVHMDPDPMGLPLKKKNYTTKCSTKSFKMTLKINKLTINKSITKGSLLFFFQFCIHYSPNE